MSATIDPMRRFRASALAGVALSLAGCTSIPESTATPPPSPALASTMSPDPAPTATSIDPSSPGQADSEWGPIWLDVPDGFPAPPRGEASEPDSGPASAAWIVPPEALRSPREVAQFYVDRYAEQGYGGGRNGPLEDGSYTAWASSGYGCDIVVTAVARGDATLATVFYGAGCPFRWVGPS
jgi:hypothetical protein